MNRRTFLSGASATLAAAIPRARAAQSGTIRLGGPVFLKSEDPRELAREHRRLGYGAGYCPEAKAIDRSRVRDIQEAFGRENVVVAEVGAWRNMLDPDSHKRADNLKYVVERLALAEAVGAKCCVDIAGSFNPGVWYGPNPKNLSADFFDATVENCRHVIDAIKPQRTKFTIEMMPWSLPDGPENYLKLIKAVDRPSFAVHLDVCNIINSPERYYNNSRVIGECFRVLGRWIASCHAKDLRWEMEYNMHFVEVGPGRGGVDYRTYLSELAKLPSNPPLMLEHLKKPEEYEEAAKFIRQTGEQLKLSFA